LVTVDAAGAAGQADGRRRRRSLKTSGTSFLIDVFLVFCFFVLLVFSCLQRFSLPSFGLKLCQWGRNAGQKTFDVSEFVLTLRAACYLRPCLLWSMSSDDEGFFKKAGRSKKTICTFLPFDTPFLMLLLRAPKMSNRRSFSVLLLFVVGVFRCFYGCVTLSFCLERALFGVCNVQRYVLCVAGVFALY